MRRLIVLAAFALAVVSTDAIGQSPGAAGGGFAPDLTGTTFGLPLLGGGVNANLTIIAGQSFSRGMSSNAPSVTVPNGVPGFVFGGSVQPFVTGLVPFVAAGSPIYRQTGLSPVGRMLMRGDIQVQKDTTGSARLFFADPPKPRVAVEPESAKAESSNPFRRGLEKYAGPKR